MNIINAGGTAWLAYENSRGILIDAGRRPDGGDILRRIRGLGVTVPLLFLTHTHYDHTGGAETVRTATGAAVAVGMAEADMLRAGYTPMPAGTGRLGRSFARAAKTLSPESRARYCPVHGDIIAIAEDGRLPTDFGFDIQAYHLGAHTAGSVGLKVGDAFFAGDIVFGFGRTLYPPFADRPDEFFAAWQAILNSGCETIYPGHGRPVPIARLEKEYIKRFISSRE
jgi:glyoxylase-like metal-dependent hydrolase (beta-lactamase superfamily II)